MKKIFNRFKFSFVSYIWDYTEKKFKYHNIGRNVLMKNVNELLLLSIILNHWELMSVYFKISWYNYFCVYIRLIISYTVSYTETKFEEEKFL